jgi:hypothetical protein
MIKRINVFSAAKVLGLVIGGFYLLAGIVVNIFLLILSLLASQKFNWLGFFSDLMGVLLFAVAMGAAAFLLSALFTWLYNKVSDLFGGIYWEEGSVGAGRLFAKKSSSEQAPIKIEEDHF